MLIGYRLTAQDDESYMLEDRFCVRNTIISKTESTNINVDNIPICIHCGRKTNPLYINSNYKAKKRKNDFIYTYDGYLLVSKKIGNMLIGKYKNENDFKKLPSDDEYFWLNPQRVIQFDVIKRKTQFENYCPYCKEYSDVIGSNPIMLMTNENINGKVIYKTDIEFGSGYEQHPLIILGIDVYNFLSSKNNIDLDVKEITA
jgi:hypothetical protein